MASEMKTALITGINGQDGSLLANYLIKNGCQVSGTFRRGSGDNLWRLNEMQILDKIEQQDISSDKKLEALERIEAGKKDIKEFIYNENILSIATNNTDETLQAIDSMIEDVKEDALRYLQKM